MPTDRQLLILATSNYCPRSFPAILSNFFSVGRDSRDLHGLSIAEVSGQQKLLTHGIVELQKPSSQVLLGAQQEQRRKATQQALSEGSFLFFLIASSALLFHEHLHISPFYQGLHPSMPREESIELKTFFKPLAGIGWKSHTELSFRDVCMFKKYWLQVSAHRAFAFL